MRYIQIILIGIIVSLFYFPFEFSYLPGINTKMILAVFGIVFVGYQSIQRRAFDTPQGLVFLFLLAGIVSIIGVFSTVYNGTTDNAYATYIISMAVWLSAAFSTCILIRTVHNMVDLSLIVYYVTGVCVCQCILAVMIDNIPQLQRIVDTYILQDQDFLHKTERLYGIGASLDTAGTRFSACLIMIAYQLRKRTLHRGKELWILVICFVIIFVLGNAIARTTSVGAIIAICYMLFTGSYFNAITASNNKILSSFLVIIAISASICIVLYNSNTAFRQMMRFAFEGFFSLVEEGRWNVSSNEKLSTMIVFPDTMKTWIIGDGYFDNPRNDIHYVGDLTGGYYKGTDIGYLRFIFYFGVIGLLAFMFFLTYAAGLASRLLKDDKFLPYLILLTGFVIWLKVATDLFLVLALLICVGYMSEKTDKELLSNAANDEIRDTSIS